MEAEEYDDNFGLEIVNSQKTDDMILSNKEKFGRKYGGLLD